ncbi:MAG: hypothetical protein AB6733_23095 [Clostridiaceae bacterium]
MNKLIQILYLLSALVILIPISIVIITDTPFSSSLSKMSITIAFVFLIIPNVLTIIKKKKEDKDIKMDIGLTIGILIAFISHLLK